mmetsp:Transcript_5975/g.13077  ORF Transcript_5975/g.13077 Transcript_5975/m.13077 type:complete len:673 (-) Transcript_5975:3-2021(-)
MNMGIGDSSSIDNVDPSPLLPTSTQQQDNYSCHNPQDQDQCNSSAISLLGRDETRSMSTVPLPDFHKSLNNQNKNASHSSSSPSWRYPIRSTNAYFTQMSSIFSGKFLSWIAIVQFSLSGGVMTLMWSIGLPLFKELGIDASRQQLYMTMIISPYALKPFIGVASDLFPIGGYNKRYLALFSIILGLLGCSVLLTLFHSGAAAAAVAPTSSSPGDNDNPASKVQRLADLIVVCFFAMNLEGATLEMLGDGKYSEIMQRHPESGSSIISFKFVLSLFGTLVTQCYVGPLADAGYFHVLFWIALVLLMAPFVPTLRGWIPEKKIKASEVAEEEEEGGGEGGRGMVKLCKGIMFHRGMFQKKKTPFVAIALSGLAAPVVSIVSTYSDMNIGLVFSGFVLVALVVTTYVVFPRQFFRAQFGLMLLCLCRIRMTSGLSYFYTANSQCLPDGPQFSYTFYITLTGIVGSVIHLIAVILYQTFMSSWKYRPALIFSMVLGSLATIVDLIIIMRWNVAIGIPDKVFFLLGSATFENLTNILHAIPMAAIGAKLAPPGMEAAGIAYSTSIGTFCFMVTNLLGSAVLKWSGMKTIGEDCDFDSLPGLVVIFQILVPILGGIAAIMLFIPNVHQTEPLIDWKKERWYEGEKESEYETSIEDEEGSVSEINGKGLGSEGEKNLV